VGRDSSVGIATRYRLDGPGIESQWVGEIFRTCPDRPWGPPSLLYSGYRVFPGGKSAGAWLSSATASRAEFKERVEQYHYSPTGNSWPALGWKFENEIRLLKWRKIAQILLCLFTVYVIVHWRFSGYFIYHRFKKVILEGDPHPRTDNEGPVGEYVYSSAYSC